MVDDWIAHTPRHILAKNFGVNESVFDEVPSPNPYIFNGTVSTRNVTDDGTSGGPLSGDSSFVYRTLQHPAEKVPGGGGEFRKIDSTNFPASKTLAATFVTLQPGGLRELHWHPNVSRPFSRAPVHIRPMHQILTRWVGGGVALLPPGNGTGYRVHRQQRCANLRLPRGGHGRLPGQLGVSDHT